VDSRNAKAEYRADRVMIAAAVRDSAGGFQAINASVHGCLRGWLLAQCRAQLHALQETMGEQHTQTLSCKAALARLLSEQGALAEAEQLSRQVLRSCQDTLGETQPDTQAAMVALARVLSSSSVDDSVQLYRAAITGMRECCRPHEPALLSAAGELAQLLGMRSSSSSSGASGGDNADGDLAEAEALARHAFGGAGEALGAEHPVTLACGSALASVLARRPATHADAAALFARVRAQEARVLGARHAAALRTAAAHARLLRDTGEADAAATLLRDTLRCQRELLGDAHPDTRATVADGGASLQQ
jgi:hypothetical protein